MTNVMFSYILRQHALGEYINFLELKVNSNCSKTNKLKYRQIKKFFALSFSDVVFIMLNNVKMPTIVGILTFMSRIGFVLS